MLLSLQQHLTPELWCGPPSHGWSTIEQMSRYFRPYNVKQNGEKNATESLLLAKHGGWSFSATRNLEPHKVLPSAFVRRPKCLLYHKTDTKRKRELSFKYKKKQTDKQWSVHTIFQKVCVKYKKHSEMRGQSSALRLTIQEKMNSKL
jgi:hypothetical protein